jgi:hypothetical protein
MAKGASFELDVYQWLHGLWTKDQLPYRKALSSVHHKKPYPSRDRGGNIITDVSVEVYRVAGADPMLIHVWECKDYGGKVGIADIEELHSKLEQIGADKTKGHMVTTADYTKSVVNYARSKGIGLVRFDAHAKLYLTEARLDEAEVAYEGLTTEHLPSWKSKFFGMTGAGDFTLQVTDYLSS